MVDFPLAVNAIYLGDDGPEPAFVWLSVTGISVQTKDGLRLVLGDDVTRITWQDARVDVYVADLGPRDACLSLEFGDCTPVSELVDHAAEYFDAVLEQLPPLSPPRGPAGTIRETESNVSL